MDTTFISIHDLSQDARILYVSNSISEILGFYPEDVVGRSCWDYFHPEELPFARATHSRGVSLDRASVLNYCRIRNKAGRWIGCECVFTVVFDVLVGCTSIYHMNAKSRKRATDAPIIRQLFSSSPRDPRYHMLSYISSKFSQGPRPHLHEPRAALFLNRFTRTLTIMYATNGLGSLLGISAADLVGKSFYFCIAEDCLPEAVRCLESAKANDSIAYLRFWYRDPRQDDLDRDEHMSDGHSSDQDSEEGGVRLTAADTRVHERLARTRASMSPRRRMLARAHNGSAGFDSNDSGNSSGAWTDGDNAASDRVFDRPLGARHSSASSMSVEGPKSKSSSSTGSPKREQSFELEAVVSCTSDGLVVVLREARPFVLDSLRSPAPTTEPQHSTGYFASPWAQEPIIPQQRSFHQAPTPSVDPPHSATKAVGTMAAATATAQTASEGFMQTIRDVAVFAWALTGINGCMAQYAKGEPAAGAQPFGGLPVWEQDAQQMRQRMAHSVEDIMQE